MDKYAGKGPWFMLKLCSVDHILSTNLSPVRGTTFLINVSVFVGQLIATHNTLSWICPKLGVDGMDTPKLYGRTFMYL